MKITITRTLGAMMLAGLLSAASPAVAGPEHGSMHHAMMKNTLMSIPNLSAEQRQKITDLLSTAKTESTPLKEQIMADRKEMATLWAADNVDKQALDAKQADLQGALGKLKNIWTDFFMQLHDVLTSPQRAWLALHGPGMNHGDDFGMGQDCQCNHQPEK